MEIGSVSQDLTDDRSSSLSAVRITDLRDGIFYAELVFDGGVEVSARPSDWFRQ